jgi:hypothetical protein
MQISKYIGTIQFIISLLVIALSIGICYATLNSSVAELNKQARVCITDHDIVVAMSTDIKWIREQIGDIKDILESKQYASITK